MTDTMRENTEIQNPVNYWTAERVDEVIDRLKSKYHPLAEDSAEVCILFEYKKLLAAQADALENIRAAELRMKIATTASEVFAAENERYRSERDKAQALVEKLYKTAKEYADAEYAYICDFHGKDSPEAESLLDWSPYVVLRKTLTKAQAFMEGK